MRRIVGFIRGGEYIRLQQPVEDVDPMKKKPRGQLITDIDPHISMVDGSYVGSRRDQREHNKRNGVVVIGEDNPKEPVRPKPSDAEIRTALLNAWDHFDAKGKDAIHEAREGKYGIGRF